MTQIVKNKPLAYPHQEGLTCGEFNARGILDAFGIPYVPQKDSRLRVRLFGYSFIEDISQLLQAHGLVAPVRFAHNLTSEEKLETILGHIDRNEPVLIAIGNGHLDRERYSPLARSFIGHFITIYGYDRNLEVFFVYDPYLKGNYKEEIPVGNEVRTFDILLRDWQGTFYYRIINMDHVYIPVKKEV